MTKNEEAGPVPLTSGSTTFVSRVFPWVFTLLAGGTTVAAWLGLLGGEAAAPVARWGLLAVTVIGSTAQHLLLGRLRHVWLDGDTLVVGDVRRGLRIDLRDVIEVKESRIQRLKTIKLRLSRPTPYGTTIHFIPRGWSAVLAPWAASPVADELRERAHALSSGSDRPPALR